jgi:hypothetical protein
MKILLDVIEISSESWKRARLRWRIRAGNGSCSSYRLIKKASNRIKRANLPQQAEVKGVV